MADGTAVAVATLAEACSLVDLDYVAEVVVDNEAGHSLRFGVREGRRPPRRTQTRHTLLLVTLLLVALLARVLMIRHVARARLSVANG